MSNTIAIPDALSLAIQCHRSGDLLAAEQIYRQVLAVDPNQNDALRLLGVIASQRGDHDLAIESIGRAIRSNPNVPFSHYDLGHTFLEVGRLDDAIASFGRALALAPAFADAHEALATALLRRGDPEGAIASYRRTLDLDPDRVDALNNLGNALLQVGHTAEAIELYRRALALAPDSATYHNNLAAALREHGNLDAALECMRRAVELQPDSTEYLNNLGCALADLDRGDEAICCLRRAIDLNPNHADSHHNLAASQFERGDFDEAIASLRRAVALDPNHADAHTALGMHLIRKGDFVEGWREYEWRLRTNDMSRPPFGPPVWDGGPLEGRTILLCFEQGLGDALQFIRFAPMLRQRGARIVLECPPSLARLIDASGLVDSVIPFGAMLPSFDTYLSLLSLPDRLGVTSIDRIPADVPYLRAPTGLTARWKRELDQNSGFKVGIVWRGGRYDRANQRRADRKRSVALSHFEPLARIPGVRLVSLQKGNGIEELAQWADEWAVVDLGDRLGDFAETAAVLENLDLLVSVDTSPIHLAAALGKPTWTALPFAGCWRWLERREDTPWYPTMRLFRQPRPDAWSDVFQRIADALRDLVRDPFERTRLH